MPIYNDPTKATIPLDGSLKDRECFIRQHEALHAAHQHVKRKRVRQAKVNPLFVRQRLIEAIHERLKETYQLKDDTRVKGQAFSYLQRSLRDAGWRGLASLWSDLDDLGFKIIKARSLRYYYGDPNGTPMGYCQVVVPKA